MVYLPDPRPSLLEFTIYIWGQRQEDYCKFEAIKFY